LGESLGIVSRWRIAESTFGSGWKAEGGTTFTREGIEVNLAVSERMLGIFFLLQIFSATSFWMRRVRDVGRCFWSR